MGLQDAEHFCKAYITVAIKHLAIEMTIPEKPTSSNQKYRLSKVGKQIQANFSNKDKV